MLALVKALEAEAAAEKLRAAASRHAGTGYDVREQTVSEINKALAATKRSRDDIRIAIKELPHNERLFAETQVETLLETLYAKEIADLKAAKRRLSKPRAPR